MHMLLRKQLELAFESRSHPLCRGVLFRHNTATERRGYRPGTTPVLPPDGTLSWRRRHASFCAPRRRPNRRTIRVEWNPRLKTCAGRADFRNSLISLNPRLRDHGLSEIDRTLRHELAHLLAQFRAGRRRILPHGPEWRQACRDLVIADETRCHNLPFAVSHRVRHFSIQVSELQTRFSARPSHSPRDCLPRVLSRAQSRKVRSAVSIAAEPSRQGAPPRASGHRIVVNGPDASEMRRYLTIA